MAFGYLTPEEESNPAALQLRARIAETMLKNTQRRGYPKTVGEGLASIGDSIAEQAQIRLLERQLAAQQASGSAVQRQFPQPAARAPATTSEDTTTEPSVRIASVEPQDVQPQEQPDAAPPASLMASAVPRPTETTSPQVTAAQYPTEPPPSFFPSAPGAASSAGPSQLALNQSSPGSLPGGATLPWMRDASAVQSLYNPRGAGPRSELAAGPANDVQASQLSQLLGTPGANLGAQYPPTASLDPGAGVTPAAPNNPVRNAVTSALLRNQLSPGEVAQSGPTQAPGIIPATFTSPAESANNREIQTDISSAPRPEAGAVMAEGPRPAATPQTGSDAYTGRNLGPLSRQPPPTQTPPDPAAYPRPTPPQLIPREPEGPAQVRLQNEIARRKQFGDYQQNIDYLQKQADELEKDRAAKDAINKTKNDKALEDFNAAQTAWRAKQLPASRADEQMKIEEANVVQRTGQRPEHFYPMMDKEQYNALVAAKAQNAQQLARRAIDAGVVTGYGSNFRVAADKFANFALKNNMGKDMAANTETMKAALQSGLMEAIQTINGAGGRVTDADLRIAQGLQGTDPNLQMQTIKTLMNKAAAINNGQIDRYEGMVHNYLGEGSQFGPHPMQQKYTNQPLPITTPDKLKMFLDTQKEGADPAQAATHRRLFDEAYGPGAADLEISRLRRRGARQ